MEHTSTLPTYYYQALRRWRTERGELLTAHDRLVYVNDPDQDWRLVQLTAALEHSAAWERRILSEWYV